MSHRSRFRAVINSGYGHVGQAAQRERDELRAGIATQLDRTLAADTFDAATFHTLADARTYTAAATVLLERFRHLCKGNGAGVGGFVEVVVASSERIAPWRMALVFGVASPTGKVTSVNLHRLAVRNERAAAALAGAIGQVDWPRATIATRAAYALRRLVLARIGRA